ncbi:MAG: LuxR C-terminal-related transcriptional regulator [Jatrophihabitantaceae bacterium]
MANLIQPPEASEIMTRFLDGTRVPLIATELHLTQGTIRNHLASIFGKVGVSSQQEFFDMFKAVRVARRELRPDKPFVCQGKVMMVRLARSDTSPMT